jgi:hypothetical protein
VGTGKLGLSLKPTRKHRGNIMKRSLLTLITILAIAAPITAFAQSGWTSPCSAGATIDEAATALYQVNNSALFFRAGRIGTVTARYDVVNTAVPSVPVTPWTTLELGYLDPTGGNVTATLFRVDPCTGKTTTICSVTSVPSPAPNCVVCTFGGGTLNFITNLYFVQVNVTRAVTTINPQALTLRVF